MSVSIVKGSMSNGSHGGEAWQFGQNTTLRPWHGSFFLVSAISAVVMVVIAPIST